MLRNVLERSAGNSSNVAAARHAVTVQTLPYCLRSAPLAQLGISGGRTEQFHKQPNIMNAWILAGLLVFFFAFGLWTMTELD